MNDKYSNDTRTLKEVMDEFEQQKYEVEKIDYRNLTDEDRNLLERYADNRDILKEARDSLDFVKSSTMCFLLDGEDGKKDIKVMSLMKDKREYADSFNTLTGGFNKAFMKEVEKTRQASLFENEMGEEEYDSLIKAPLQNEEIRIAFAELYKDIPKEDTMTEKTVSDIYKIAVLKDLYKEQYEIGENTAIDTYDKLCEKRESGLAIEFASEESDLHKDRLFEEYRKENEPVEIVESSDGYVMNHSKVTAENFRTLDERIDNNTVHNTQTRETTTDKSRVGGNVKFEEAKDYGSVEENIIESGGSLDYATEKAYYNSIDQDHPDEVAFEQKTKPEKSENKNKNNIEIDR